MKSATLFAGTIILVGILVNFGLSYLPFLLAVDDFVDYLENDHDYNKFKNRYLQGNYAPIEDEMVNVDLKLPVFGKLPNNFEGLFMRIGPNAKPSHGFKKGIHWFGEFLC